MKTTGNDDEGVRVGLRETRYKPPPAYPIIDIEYTRASTPVPRRDMAHRAFKTKEDIGTGEYDDDVPCLVIIVAFAPMVVGFVIIVTMILDGSIIKAVTMPFPATATEVVTVMATTTITETPTATVAATAGEDDRTIFLLGALLFFFGVISTIRLFVQYEFNISFLDSLII